MGEEASGAFAVLDVWTSRLFEQPSTGEHRGQSLDAPRHRPQSREIQAQFVPDQRSGTSSRAAVRRRQTRLRLAK